MASSVRWWPPRKSRYTIFRVRHGAEHPCACSNPKNNISKNHSPLQSHRDNRRPYRQTTWTARRGLSACPWLSAPQRRSANATFVCVKSTQSPLVVVSLYTLCMYMYALKKKKKSSTEERCVVCEVRCPPRVSGCECVCTCVIENLIKCACVG